jgi:hypothetical protein
MPILGKSSDLDRPLGFVAALACGRPGRSQRWVGSNADDGDWRRPSKEPKFLEA